MKEAQGFWIAGSGAEGGTSGTSLLAFFLEKNCLQPLGAAGAPSRAVGVCCCEEEDGRTAETALPLERDNSDPGDALMCGVSTTVLLRALDGVIARSRL